MSVVSFFSDVWAWAKAHLGRRAREDRKPSRGERAFARMFAGTGAFGLPGGWSQDRFEQIRQYRHWTYIAVRAIAEEIAGLPPKVAFRRTPEEVASKGLRTKGMLLAPYYRKKAMAHTQSHEELQPADSSHPLCRILADPNGPDTAETFWQRTVINLELTGNAYWWAVPNRLGLPAELWVMPSHWVWPSPDRDPDHLVDYYEIRPYGASASRSLRLPADEIIHIPYPSAITPFDGWSPLAAGAEWVDIASSMDTSRFASFKQGIWPGLILELAADMQDPDDATVARLYARLAQRFQGEMNVDRPMILSPGAKVADRTRPPREMDFVQGSDQMRDWVLALHRVSKVIAGITEEVNRASMDTAAAVFSRWTIRPKLRLIGGIATEHLARRWDDRLVMYWDDPSSADPQQELDRLCKLVQAGLMTPNEARAELGLPAYEHGGDDPLVGQGLSELPLATGKKPDQLPVSAGAAERWDEDQSRSQQEGSADAPPAGTPRKPQRPGPQSALNGRAHQNGRG